MEEIINNCTDIKEYLAICEVDSVEDLSESQLIAWAKSGKMGFMSKFSTEIVESGIFGEKPNKVKALRLLRQAIQEDKEFYCVFIENESAIGPIKSDNGKPESFQMFLKDRKG